MTHKKKSVRQFQPISAVSLYFGHGGITIRMANEAADVAAGRQMFGNIEVMSQSTFSHWSPIGQ